MTKHISDHRGYRCAPTLASSRRQRKTVRPYSRRQRKSRLERLEARAMLAAEIDFNDFVIEKFGGRQDKTGTVTVEQEGAALRMEPVKMATGVLSSWERWLMALPLARFMDATSL